MPPPTFGRKVRRPRTGPTIQDCEPDPLTESLRGGTPRSGWAHCVVPVSGRPLRGSAGFVAAGARDQLCLRPQAMSKPTNGRRVEWLPGLDENPNSRETNPPAEGDIGV